jgi:hypothetical protein
MRKSLVVSLVAVAAVSLGGFGPTAFASGGSGGGGGGGGAGGGSGGGGGGTKASCTNTLTVTATATEDLAGNSFLASYALVACQPRTRVSMTATDLSTGAVVWSSLPDIAGTVALWSLPYTLTSYRIDARAYAAGVLVASGSTTVDTLNPLPCDVYIHETTTVGYWSIYAAIWSATDARDCGLGGSTVRLRITNMSTGAVSLDYPWLPMSSLVDYEGPIVAYNTPYHVQAELVSSKGVVLASTSADVVSAPLR